MASQKWQKRFMKKLDRIKRLAEKKGTPLVAYLPGKTSVIFQYKIGEARIKGISYPTLAKGIAGEIKRLGG